MLGVNQFIFSYAFLGAFWSLTALFISSLLVARLCNINFKSQPFYAICIGYLQIIASTNLAYFVMREVTISYNFFGAPRFFC